MTTKYVLTTENERRCEQGRQAAVAGSGDLFDDEDATTAITDTLANLMHYAQMIGADFEDQLRIARNHFDVEATGEE